MTEKSPCAAPTVEGLMDLVRDYREVLTDALTMSHHSPRSAPDTTEAWRAVRSYAKRLSSTPVQGVLTDEQVDRMLDVPIPGGSQARDWFLPHEHPKGLANVRNVVRAMCAAAEVNRIQLAPTGGQQP